MPIASFRQTLTASPIGLIPKSYERLTDLCKKAHIRYNDEKLEEGVYRSWRVVPDDEPAYDRRGRVAGNGTRGYSKFCMLLDYIEHLHPDYSRRQVLDSALDDDWKKFNLMSWSEMNNELAKRGVDGYTIRKEKDKSVDETADSLTGGW